MRKMDSGVCFDAHFNLGDFFATRNFACLHQSYGDRAAWLVSNFMSILVFTLQVPPKSNIAVGDLVSTNDTSVYCKSCFVFISATCNQQSFRVL